MHLWYIQLDELTRDLEGLRDTLSGDEIDRANRFRFERDRVRYVAGRGALRRVLASYTGERPRDVALAYGEFGKPRLATRTDVRFNLAHSTDHALLGVTMSRELGVDIERVHDISDMESLTKTCFAGEERRQLTAMATSDERLRGFFRGWTRKEAVLKALGSGLSKPLDSFEVSLQNERPSLLRMSGEADASQRWRIIHVVPDDACVGAAAWIGPDLRVQCFTYRAQA